MIELFSVNEKLSIAHPGNPHKNRFEITYLENRAKIKLKN